MRRLIVLVLALAFASVLAAEDRGNGKQTCSPIDLSKLAGYYTASDGSFVTLEFMPATYHLGRGQSKVSMSKMDSAVHFAMPAGKVPAGKILVATTKCGGTKDCSSKSCQNTKDSCVEGMHGCFCQ